MSEPRGPDILLVEDDRDELEIALTALRRGGRDLAIAVARDGEEAITAVFGRDGATPPAPRLILLDLKLPKMTGLEVLRRLKADERTRPIPVVMLTSSKLEEDVRSCYLLGANSYVVKPVDFTEFAAALVQLSGYWLGLNQLPA